VAEVTRLLVDRLHTPIGALVLAADIAGQLRAVEWADDEARLFRALRIQYGRQGFTVERERDPGGLTTALFAYFEGELEIIDGLPVEMLGTPFQRAVWAALREIPCGTTLSYSELASWIHRPSAVRAVGRANGANPVAVVVPCHRVVGQTGSLTGYGGGIERKRWLLAHEGALSSAGRNVVASTELTGPSAGRAPSQSRPSAERESTGS
jgi:methylated-DNA-[protein]-cysteine S-methyltransferase